MLAVRSISISVVRAAVLAAAAAAEQIDPGQIRVIDGDTIRIDGQKPDHRLVGFNAPETRRAANETERELGGKATARLRAIVRAGGLDYTLVPCACRTGAEGTPWCNYGRPCGMPRSHGEDVGEILIREGLAVPFVCGEHSWPRTPNPWR
jgi:endonuclease YncB( thermonuclease family)